MTIVYNMDDQGNITELVYSIQNVKEALKTAYLQHVKKNLNTWDYDKVNVSIEESEKGYYIDHGLNSVIWTRKQ
jgi:coproporphyrinogen III oxidase